MASKGVDYYFVNSTQNSLKAWAKNTDGSWALSPTAVGGSPMITKGNCQIDWNFPWVDPYGSFSFATETQPKTSFNTLINAVTGNIAGSLENMMRTPSLVTNDFALSYGMYDAGSAKGTGLTDQHQIYAYLTKPQKRWMGDLADSSPAVKKAPFASFVLPGAHDAGTFDLGPIDTLCMSAGGIAALIGTMLWWIPGATVLTGLAAMQLKGVLVGEAVTQKDNIATMLDLGCRYFDFRPGYAPAQIRGLVPDLYHIHGVVPGQPLDAFFTDILNWLKQHPTEIVAIALGTDGFADHDTMDPSTDTLKARFAAAQQKTDTASIQIGAAEHLKTSYGDLIRDNRRLFFLNSPSLGWNGASKYDSYSDDYESSDPNKVMTAIAGMTRSGQAGRDYTVLQLQLTATAQNVKNIVVALATSTSNAHNPLMSTKPKLDSLTYPWLLQNVSKLSETNLLVLLNDFVDNALAGSVASVLTRQRCEATTRGG